MKTRLAMLFVVFGYLTQLIAATETKPNVVFILADDLGYGDLGCYRAPDIKTPNIDRLAREGVRFTDFYANGCVCTPTRCGLMTGRYQQRIGGLETAIPPGAKHLGLPAQEKTLADMLRAAGYRTSISGKWHLGYKPEMMPTAHGFNHHFGLLSGNHDYFSHKENNGEADLYLDGKPVEVEGYSTHLITDDAVKSIAQSAADILSAEEKAPARQQHVGSKTSAGPGKPFFLYVAFNAPHAPFEGPEDTDKKPDVHSWNKGTRETYVKMVEEMDSGVGKILEALDKHGFAENTLVVFESDNGGASLSRNLPLAKYKGSLWEGGVRVPCIARFPGRIPAGTETHQVGITMDWSATIAKLAGAKPPKDRPFEGVDLLPLISGKKKSVDRTLFWRSVDFSFVKLFRAVRDGDWKFIENYRTGEKFLYNLHDDIGERNNLLVENVPVANKLKAKLDKWEADVDPPLYPAEPSIPPKAAANRPNVLLIVTDDQGFGDFSAHGNPHLKTPVFDRLAEQSVEFNRFFVSPVCAPTRASMLTGRYWLRGGVWGVTGGKETMRTEETTVAEILRSAGYRTGIFGKWHNGEHYPCTPQAQGFDEFFGFRAGHWNQYFNPTLEHNGQPVQTKGFITDILTDEAIKFLEQSAPQSAADILSAEEKASGRRRNVGPKSTVRPQNPFFCYVPYNAPHAPFQVPDKYFDPFKKLGLDDETAAVYGLCANLDENIGRLLAKLDDLKLTENTIVIFMTDNGANTDRFNAGMRGRKGSVHEGGTRVPLLVRWPGKLKPHKVDEIAAHVDLLPTLLDLCNVPISSNASLDGTNLRPLLENSTNTWRARTLFTFHPRGENPGQFPGAARTQQYRLVNEGKGYELYDMLADPGETKDIAASNPEIVRQLSSEYETWFSGVTTNVFKRPVIPIGYAEQNPALLQAPEAVLSGGVVFKNKQGFAHDWVAGWTNATASVSWDIDVVRSGDYQVALEYLCLPAEAGSRVRVSAGESSVDGVVAAMPLDIVPLPNRVKTKERYVMMKWKPVDFGTFHLEKGKTRLVVQALNKPSAEVMELKSVSLARKN